MSGIRIKKVISGISEDWLKVLYSPTEHKLGRVERSSKQLLDRIVEDMVDIPDARLCPEPNQWLEFARLTPFDKVRIIIIGQDPYHTKKNGVCYAHGLAFSCKGKVSPSLRNIYKCLERTDLLKNQKEIKTGDLTSWANQGVLMLNASLSTEMTKPNAHQHLWSTYTEFIIQRLCENAFNQSYQLMFFLWGKNAQKIEHLIDGEFHIIKKWAHPSPMSQGSLSDKKKFINCDHFKDANNFLDDWDFEPIQWTVENSPDSDSDSDSDIEIEMIAVAKDEKKSDSNWFNGHPKKIVVFTDGSCYPTKKTPKARGGYAASFVQGPFKDTVIYGSLVVGKNYASNIRAEGQAIISVLDFLETKLDDWGECVIVTDCEFWINMVNKYMPKWSKEQFKKKANTDMTQDLWKKWKALMSNKELSFYHVRSHNKNGWKSAKDGTFEKYCYEQNDYVDELCGYARKALKPGEISISKAEYE
jgi:uracil-DNA glycosylase